VSHATTPPDSDDERSSGPHPILNDQPSYEDNETPYDENDIPLPLPQVEVQRTGRQKAVATVEKVHPPAIISRLTGALNKSTLRIVENVRGHYAVSGGEQPDGILTNELRVGMKRAAAAISRSQYEIYSFATRHDLSEAATDELLQLVSNVSNLLSSVIFDDLWCISHAVKYNQMRFHPQDIQYKTMKSMDRAARLAMLPDCQIFCVDLKEGTHL